ncbi:MAG TPA: fused MFS/spermidine synthase, partial [Blastocatellia bacterium]|nr:fused MFS/spermidine synthase [Blastocatellia bacterium]
MKKSNASTRTAPQRWLPVLLLLFVGSGGAALIYEIVWLQLLQLVIGSSAVSLGVLLGTFMGGMCLGSWLLPRWIDARRHPLRVYAALELGIAACGILILLLMPLIGGAYTMLGFSGPFVRAIVAGLCLLPPTLLMGATLPAVARWVEATPEGVSWLGFFYGGNIAGAVFGSLLAGFYLLRVYDLTITTMVAVALNVSVALLAIAVAQKTKHEPTEPGKAEITPATRTVYVTIALSGLTALAAEVIWTRNLSLLFGGTVYTFSLILAVFLLGLGIGSSVGSRVARQSANPRAALGWCQLLLCLAILWTAYLIGASLPFWPIQPSLASDPWFTFQLDFVRCLWTILPGALLWGMSFPLALAAVATQGQDTGRLVGGVYAANTVGAIVGSLSSSLLLVAWIGTQRAQQWLIVLSALAGLLLLVPMAWSQKAQRERNLGLLVAATVGAWFVVQAVPVLPGILVAEGRYTPSLNGRNEIIFVGEGTMASVAVSRTPEGYLQYHNAGKVQASGKLEDMRLQRMLGHITTLLPPQPRSVLVIGCGAGVTAGAVSIDPQVERVTIAEIEPLVPQVVSKYFSKENHGVIGNPKVRVQLDDGRHFLLTTDEKFDAITSDPLDPWVKGAAMLYTKEFFEVVKRRLNPGGVVTIFVQLYQTSEEAVKSELATFFEVFPEGVIFGNTQDGEGYDLVLLGQAEAAPINIDAVEARLQRPEYSVVAQSLSELGFRSAVDLFSTYAGRGTDLKEWRQGAAINHDRDLRLQYLAGLGLNLDKSFTIYRNLIKFNRYPDNLF